MKPPRASHLAAFDMEAWLDTLPAPQRTAMANVRDIIRAEVPSVQETRSYGLPAFKINGRGFLCINVWKAHCALYPMSATIIADHGSALQGYDCSKGTIKFQPERPLPVDLVTSIIQARLSEMGLSPTQGQTV